MRDVRKRIEGLTDAVRQVLKDHDGAVWWKGICDEIKDRGLVIITREQEELAYGQPNFQHSVRRILTELTRRGEAIWVSRGMYMYNKNRRNHATNP